MGEDFDLFTKIEDIAKDIQEQENKVIAMEFTKNIGYLLIENGVRVKITEYTKEIDENNSIESTFESRYGISIDGLDFTEHDKVFEDKIAELKKDCKTASELLCKYQQENESLKKRIIELENFSCQAEQETESLVEKLKQRIAELEEENECKDAVNKCWSDHVHDLHKENVRLIHDIDKIAKSKSEWIDRAVEWQQKCEKLESKEKETCEKEPISDDCRPSMEWYENRHQSDCIEINRLNTTIDVLIHKVEYLRQFVCLE